MKEDLSPSWTCQLYHLEQKCFSSTLHKRQKSSSSFWDKDARRTGGGRIGNLIIADLDDIENHVAFDVHVKRSTSKEVGIKKLQDAFMFHCADGSSKQEGHAHRQTSRHHRVESVDVGGYPQLWARRGVTVLQCARGDSLQEEGVVADFSDGDRGAMEAWEYFWCVWGIYLSPIRDAPRTLLCTERVIIFALLKYVDVVRQTIFKLDKLDESIVEDVWNMDAQRRFSKNWSGSTHFRILNKRPPNGYS